MDEYKYWQRTIEWLLEKEKVFVFHNSHKTTLMEKALAWVNNIENKNKIIIKEHNLNLEGAVPDFISLDEDILTGSFYINSLEIKGDVGYTKIHRGIHQATAINNL